MEKYVRTLSLKSSVSRTKPTYPAQMRFRADRFGLGPWFRAHSKGGVEAHLFAIEYFLLTLVVSEI